MKVGAIESLKGRMTSNNTLACCGLDPDLNKFPDDLSFRGLTNEEKTGAFLRQVVDLTADSVCAYKLQKAFFDRFPLGHGALKDIISYIHTRHQGIPAFVDCKIGDVDNTMCAYLGNLFGELNADGIVVNPYMGDDVMKPMTQYPDKAIIVLAKTSNPGGGIVQDVLLNDGKPLWQHILKLTTERWNTAGNMIPVISSTVGLDLIEVRRLIPDKMPILLAGVGAQGGSYSDLGKLLNSKGHGVFVNSSREILYPKIENGQTWQNSIRLAVTKFKDELNKERQ